MYCRQIVVRCGVLAVRQRPQISGSDRWALDQDTASWLAQGLKQDVSCAHVCWCAAANSMQHVCFTHGYVWSEPAQAVSTNTWNDVMMQAKRVRRCSHRPMVAPLSFGLLCYNSRWCAWPHGPGGTDSYSPAKCMAVQGRSPAKWSCYQYLHNRTCHNPQAAATSLRRAQK